MRHPILYGLALLLALLVALAAYHHSRLPDWLERQAESILSAHGVREVELGPLQFSPDQLSTEYLRLRGEIDGYSFDISATGLVVGYEPRALFRGQTKSLTVARLTLSLTESAGSVAGGETSVALSEFSPHTVLSALPLETAKVVQWQLEYQPLQGVPVEADGALSWDKGLVVSYRAALPDLLLAGTISAPSSDALQLDVQASARDGAQLGTLRADVQCAPTNRWRWALEGDVFYAPVLDRLRALTREQLVFADPLSLDALVLSGEGNFEGRLEHADTISFSGPALFEQFQGDFQLRSLITELSWRSVLDAGSGNTVITADLAGDALALTLGATEFEGKLLVSALELPEETRRWLRWGQTVPLLWRNPGEASLSLDTSGAMSLRLEGNRVLLGDQHSQLRWDAISLYASRDAQSPSVLNAALKGRLDARLRQQQLPQLQLTLRQRGTIGQNEFNLQLVDTAQSLRLVLDGSVSPQTGQGSYHADLQSLDLAYASSVLVPLLQKFDVLPQAPTLNSGAFNLVSDVRSGSFALDALTQQSALKIEGASGAYGEYQFEGLSLDANWSGVKQWQTRRPVELAIDRLNVGFEITGTQVRLSLPKPTSLSRPVVRIDGFESGMFGGRVHLPEPRFWDFGSSSNSITLRADDWNLADMVALQRGYDIEAQGVLEGELPVTVADGRVIIEKGYLRALEPGGTIRFKADAASQALVANSSELALAMGLLEDFRYRTMSSAVELDPLGNLLLALSLEGSNPARYDGRPIRFNINLEQNLDPLLQSLRLSDSLVEKVEKGLR